MSAPLHAQQIRHMCRKCRDKLPEPTDNLRKALSARAVAGSNTIGPAASSARSRLNSCSGGCADGFAGGRNAGLSYAGGRPSTDHFMVQKVATLATLADHAK
jgi:hypothetical protein